MHLVSTSFARRLEKRSIGVSLYLHLCILYFVDAIVFTRHYFLPSFCIFWYFYFATVCIYSNQRRHKIMCVHINALYFLTQKVNASQDCVRAKRCKVEKKCHSMPYDILILIAFIRYLLLFGRNIA